MMAREAQSMIEPAAEALDARAVAGEHIISGSAIPARVVRKVCRIMTGLSLLCAVLILFAPNLSMSQSIVVSGFLVVLLAVSLLVHPLADRHPEFAFSVLLGSSMAIIFGSMLVQPKSVDISMVPMVLCVVAITIVSGIRGGVIAAVVATVLTVLAGAFGSTGLDWFKFLLFGIFAFATVAIVDGMTRDRRRIAYNLARYYEALRASSVSSPDLNANLDAIAESVNLAVGSAWCAVLLKDGERLEVAAPTATRDSSIAERIRQDSLDRSIGGPVLDAIDDHAIVVIDDVESETRYPLWREVWAPILRSQNMPSLVLVPLRSGDESLGVLTVHGRTRKAFNVDDIALLRAYAEQIALVILRAQAYESERESANRLAEADQLKSEFLAMVSHELRTPLTAAKGFIDTVLLHWDRLDDERRKDLLRRSSGNANELTRLISQLLDFARIDANRVDLKPLNCNLRELVDRVTADLASITAERTIAVDIDEQIKIVSDPDAFNHVLVNLITNANKFSPEGSTIHITAAMANDEVVVSVADEGMGIAEDELEKVFERFYQSERTNMTRKGTGIGLAIVKRFVESQGGRIWVESVLGEGATFRFSVARADQLPPGVPAKPPSVAPRSEDDTQPGGALVS